MKTAEAYLKPETGCRQGASFVPFEIRGYTCIDVLTFLKGKPWDDVALGYVHGLRPTHVRLTTGLVQCDSQTWRVTVFLEKDEKTIARIEQEIEVGLPAGVPHGSGLAAALKYGLNSPQVEWHNKPGGYVYNGITGECYKQLGEKTYPWPISKKNKK